MLIRPDILPDEALVGGGQGRGPQPLRQWGPSPHQASSITMMENEGMKRVCMNDRGRGCKGATCLNSGWKKMPKTGGEKINM